MPRKDNLLCCMNPGLVEAGCDEAGRGPLAGPVFAAAVILPQGFTHPLLDDSKKMSAKARNEMRGIIESQAVAWAVEEVSVEDIDSMNILWASVEGMRRAVRRLGVKPDFVLVDGNRFRPMDGYRYATVIHGDAIYASIAAASVLAKTHRDERMLELSREYPMYGWEHNMGYPTPAHIEAVRRYGLTPYHRRSFHPKALEPSLF